jgi:hypothetical protein
MTDSTNPTNTTTPSDTDTGSPAVYPGTPRWVRISGITALVLIVLVVAVLVVTTALGLHTPGGPGGHLALLGGHG